MHVPLNEGSGEGACKRDFRLRWLCLQGEHV